MLEIEKIKSLYRQGKFATEIDKALGIPWRKVIYLEVSSWHSYGMCT